MPHSDISIVANNSDNWYSGNKVDRDGDGVDDRAEGAGKGAGIGAGLGGAAGLLAGLGCSRSQASARSLRRAGWPRPPLAPLRVQPRAASSERSRKPASPRTKRRFTPKASAAVGRSYRRACPMLTGPASMPF